MRQSGFCKTGVAILLVKIVTWNAYKPHHNIDIYIKVSQSSTYILVPSNTTNFLYTEKCRILVWKFLLVRSNIWFCYDASNSQSYAASYISLHLSSSLVNLGTTIKGVTLRVLLIGQASFTATIKPTMLLWWSAWCKPYLQTSDAHIWCILSYLMQ